MQHLTEEIENLVMAIKLVFRLIDKLAGSILLFVRYYLPTLR